MGNSKPNRATLKDVAELAGVSMQTVSRVVNNVPKVAPATVKRVTRVMQELDYQPNTVARILQTRRSYTLEVIALDIPLLPAPLVQMAASARSHGYHMVFTTGAEEELDTIVESMQSRVVDGFIVVAPRMQDIRGKLSELNVGIPFVSMSVGAPEENSQIPTVLFDQKSGMKMLVEHLQSQGHRHIAEISGPLDHQGGRSRHEILMELAKEYDISVEPAIAVDFSMEGGVQGIDYLLNQNVNFTAIIAGNDDIALGAIHRLREHNIRVPEDISITGFDDIPHAAYVYPPLTTVKQDFYKLGNLATDYLISLIEDENALIYERVLKPELIIRKSTRQL
ncbi:MAG: LacI family DNA-binding transcriptional regulator [Aggregatilineales bacterium]